MDLGWFAVSYSLSWWKAFQSSMQDRLIFSISLISNFLTCSNNQIPPMNVPTCRVNIAVLSPAGYLHRPAAWHKWFPPPCCAPSSAQSTWPDLESEQKKLQSYNSRRHISSVTVQHTCTGTFNEISHYQLTRWAASPRFWSAGARLPEQSALVCRSREHGISGSWARQ